MFGPGTVAESVVLWTARLAVALYVIALAWRLNSHSRPSWLRWARVIWTTGFIVFVVHVASAFHYYHHWSHAEAWASTAQQTEAAVRWAWGDGIYANYLFMVVWGLDVLWWWVWPGNYLARPVIVKSMIQGYLAFIAFNATVVFGRGATRWVALAGFAGLGYLLSCRRCQPAK